MTKKESLKCEKLLTEAIRTAKQAEDEFSLSEKLAKEGDKIQSEIEQRKADNHTGYAEGIEQVLSTLGFKHDRMKELQKLL